MLICEVGNRKRAESGLCLHWIFSVTNIGFITKNSHWPSFQIFADCAVMDQKFVGQGIASQSELHPFAVLLLLFDSCVCVVFQSKNKNKNLL